MLVEDNLINQALAHEVLKNAGMKVTLANDGQQAVNCVESQEFAAILMDIRMPHMDGLEATRIIRQNRNYDHIPIIAISAGVLKHEIDKALALGCNQYVTKPVDFDRLLDQLTELIDSRFYATDSDIVSPAKNQVDASQPQLDIPELDLARALKNHNENSELFRRLLGDFVGYYQDAPQTLKQQLSANEIGTAERLAHNIAGVAGSFAADDLMHASRQLERAIAAGELENWQPLIAQFEDRLNSLVNSIQQCDLGEN